jgi:hypothetical protein
VSQRAVGKACETGETSSPARSRLAHRDRSEWFGCPQAQTASYCASRVCQLVGASRSIVRAPKIRLRSAWPAARLASEAVKKTLR